MLVMVEMLRSLLAFAVVGIVGVRSCFCLCSPLVLVVMVLVLLLGTIVSGLLDVCSLLLFVFVVDGVGLLVVSVVLLVFVGMTDVCRRCCCCLCVMLMLVVLVC